MQHLRFHAECRQIGRLAGPLIVGQVSQVGMGFTDTVMAGRLGPADLAAVAIGTTLWVPVHLGCVGIMTALSPLVAHHSGAGRGQCIAPLFRQALWLAVALGGLAFILTAHSAILTQWLNIDAAIIPVTAEYMDAVAWGMPGVCFFLTLRYVSDGIGYTQPIMYIQLVGLTVNVAGNYVFMFGALGIEGMGAVGAGWSSALVFWLNAILLFSYSVWHRRYRSLELYARFEPPRLTEAARLLKLGAPIGLTLVLEVGMFTAVALLMGTLGVVAVAAHQIAFNYAALAFMVPLAISMATTVRVGNAVGADEPDRARLAGFAGMAMAMAAMAVSAAVMLCLPEAIAGLYTTDAEVAGLAVSLLFMAALFQLSDGLQVGAMGALRGLKDTAWPLLINFVAYWLVGLPLAWLLGIQQAFGPRGLWAGLVVGLTAAAIWLSYRFHRLTRMARPARAAVSGNSG